MRAGLDGVLFGGKSEGVPAHGMEDIVSPHTPVARYDICGCVALQVADVQAGTRWVGEHVEDVALRLL